MNEHPAPSRSRLVGEVAPHAVIMSVPGIPEGLIGSPCSWCGPITFSTNAAGDSIISIRAASRSALFVTVRAGMPNPAATPAKSGYGALPSPAPR